MPRFEPSPQPTPRPGGPLFTSAADWWHNAVLDTFGGSWYSYAEGYKRAADGLVLNVSSDRRGIDFMIYPIMFLYRQYLELSLKTMIVDADRLLHVEVAVPATHNLKALWKQCRSRLETTLKDELKGEDVEIIENCVSQFADIDPGSFHFRYPVDKGGEPIMHPVSHVNVRNLMEEMANAGTVIETISNYLVVLRDLEGEYVSDWGP